MWALSLRTAFMGHWQQLIEYDDSTSLGAELFVSTQKIWVVNPDEEPVFRTYTIIQKNNEEFNLLIEMTNENQRVYKRYVTFSDDRKEMRIEWSKFTSYSHLYIWEKYKRIDSKRYPG